MSVKPARLENTNFQNMNVHNVVSQPVDPVRVPVRNNRTAASSTYVKPEAQTAPVETKTDPAATTTTTTTTPASEKITREKRREDWSALEQARKERQQAQELAKRAEKLTEIEKSPSKLTALAQALGKTPDQLLIDLQSERLALPNDKELSKDEIAAQKEKEYHDRLTAAEKQAQFATYTVAKSNYTMEHLIPVLTSDKDNFEFCHKYGITKCTSEVYDYMNLKYIESGGTLQLDPKECLQEFEKALYDEWLAHVDYAKDLKKTQSFFGKKNAETPELDGSAEIDAGLTEAQKLLADSPTAKRIGKTTQANSIVANAVNKQNKLSSEVKPGAKYDRQSRLDRLKKEQGLTG